MGSGLDVSAVGFDGLVAREWLTTNALGGYACSTIPCLNSRKYHGLLVAAMAPPVRRMVLLSRVEETIYLDGWPFPLATNEYPGTIHPEGYRLLRAFSHEPHPRWAYQGDGWTLEKSLHLLPGRNTVVLRYSLLGGDKPVELEVRPLFALRGIHELTYQWQAPLTVESVPRAKGQSRAAAECLRIPATGRTPEVFFAHDGVFTPEASWYLNTIYRREQERGYPGLEDLWTPGPVRFKLAPGATVRFACSADSIELAGLASVDAPDVTVDVSSSDATYAALARAAHQFVAFVPRPVDSTNADADADDHRPAVVKALAAAAPRVAVVSHYPWAAPSIRLALIAFPGLFLVTGRHAEGRAFLASLAPLLDQGLLPSEFPEEGSTPIYQGADVSLWFVHAVHQYLRCTGDEPFVRGELFEAIAMIVHYYRTGTRLGITADAQSLISTNEPGAGTTWMDAKAGDWVVTPRAGMPVELNALWYNALCVTAELSGRFGEPQWAAELTDVARSIKESFNRRFWNDDAGCCYDVVGEEGSDASVRPNQLLAASLPFAVLDLPRHEAVLRKVCDELLTPVGVRTLSPSDPNYQGRYAGNLAARDRAHHNGSAFPWLLGPLVTAHVKVHGRGQKSRAEAMDMIRGCIDFLDGDGLGQLCELFDGNAPHAPGGAIAAAAAVGEVLRAYAEYVLGDAPDEPAADAPPTTDGSEIADSPVLEVFLPPPVPQNEPA